MKKMTYAAAIAALALSSCSAPESNGDSGLPTSPDEKVYEFKTVTAEGYFYGPIVENVSSSLYEIYLTNYSLDRPGATKPAYCIVLSFFDEAGSVMPSLGKYDISTSYASGTAEAGFVQNTSAYGTILCTADSNGNFTKMETIRYGWFSLDRISGGTLRLAFELETDDLKIRGEYSGDIAFTDSRPEDGGDEEEDEGDDTTLEGPVNLNLVGASCSIAYYGDYYEIEGYENWTVEIAKDGGDDVYLDLIVPVVDDHSTFPAAKIGRQEVSFDPEYYLPGINGGFPGIFGDEGSWYYDLRSAYEEDGDTYVDVYAAIVAGEATFSLEGSNLKVVMDFADSKGNAIKGSWTGALPEVYDGTADEDEDMSIAARRERKASRIAGSHRPARTIRSFFPGRLSGDYRK